MTEYNQVMQKEVTDLLHQGYKTSVFGDILLEDLKAYREKEFEGSGIQTLFPLWKKNTSKLIKEFINLGYKAIVVCTNSAYLDNDFCGRIIDHNFLKDLPTMLILVVKMESFTLLFLIGPFFLKIPFRLKF